MNKSRISYVLKNGDCLELIKTIPDKSIDLVVTDPPYEVAINGGSFYDSKSENYRATQYSKEIKGISDGFTPEILNEIVRVLKKVNVYFFCSQKQIPKLLDYFLNNYSNKDHELYHRKINWNLLIWSKTNPIPACGNKYLSDAEYILFFREQGVKVYGNYETKKTHYETPLWVQDKKLYNHPTCKPVFMLKNFIINSSQENEVVLDPFMGSGSTGEAAIKLNRKFIGFEIDEQYFETAKKRVENAISS